MRTSKGFRNQFEERLGSFLDDRRIAYEYETLILGYTLEGKYKVQILNVMNGQLNINSNFQTAPFLKSG